MSAKRFTPRPTTRFASPSCATGVTVRRGPTLDGLGKYLRDEIEAPTRDCNVSQVLKETGTESSSPTCRSAPSGPCAGMPSRRSRPAAPSSTACRCSSPPTRTGARASRRAELPIIGDDIKSQVGATIVHRVLTNLFRERGVRLDRTYQLNFGGNTDFRTCWSASGCESKKISKTQAVTSQLDVPLDARNMHVGPSDYVPWLTDRKFCHIRMEGTTFGGVPLNVEVKLEVWDSPEFRRRRHRRGALRQARARPRHRRRAGRPFELFHEVAARSSSPTTRRASGR